MALFGGKLGDCLLIDLTEASVMDNSHPTSFDVQLAKNFVSEFSSLMMLPDNDGVLRYSILFKW